MQAIIRRATLLPLMMRAHRPSNPARRLPADRPSDRQIVNLTQRLIAAKNPDEATELAGQLINAIREHIDRLRDHTANERPSRT